MRQFPEITDDFRHFIEKQSIFFVGAAGRIGFLTAEAQRTRRRVLRRDFLSLRRQDAKFSKADSEVITAEVQRAQRFKR